MVEETPKATVITASMEAATSAAKHSKDANSKKEPLAYAKLWGKLNDETFYAYIVSLPTTLGRGLSASEGTPGGFIDLGKSKALSRKHAVITWAAAERQYKIKCLGKNGMVVAGKFRAKDGEESLYSRTPIKLGPAHIYFLLPEGDLEHDTPNRNRKAGTTGGGGAKSAAAAGVAAAPQAEAAAKPTATSATIPASKPTVKLSFDNMVSGAFRSPELAPTATSTGLSRGEVETWVTQHYPEWKSEGEKEKLTAGIDGVLKGNFASRGADRWVESSTLPTAKRQRLETANANDAAASITTNPVVQPTKQQAPPGASGSGGSTAAGQNGAAGVVQGAGIDVDVGGSNLSPPTL